jgi:mono/diheme cytochrome c family protein
VDGVSFLGVDPKIAEGYSIYKNRCLTCHTEGLILSQPLREGGWKKVIGKMKSFGAKISETEEPLLLVFLNSIKSPSKRSEQHVSYQTESKKYQINSQTTPQDGQNHYELNCSVCHGVNGEGKIGPRLRGRLIPKHQFFSAVSQGKNSMPAFGEQLKQKEIELIWAYIQRPTE